MKTIYTEINNRETFGQLLQNNPGLIVVKFGATWCKPCRDTKAFVYESFKRMPENVICFDIDVDECFDIYAALKAKRMVNGIPVILAYKKGNMGPAPDFSVTGADDNAINHFFMQVFNASQGL
jgi:thiol-disulfide isomerase/thioredoxin